jgi:hypothetical protein
MCCRPSLHRRASRADPNAGREGPGGAPGNSGPQFGVSDHYAIASRSQFCQYSAMRKTTLVPLAFPAAPSGTGPAPSRPLRWKRANRPRPESRASRRFGC